MLQVKEQFNMNKLHYSLLLSSILLLFSCRPKEVFDFPITLEATEIVSKGEIRMFVGEKEVYNQEIITMYVNQV